MATSLRKSAEAFRGRSAQSLRSSHDEAYLLLSTIRGCMDRGDSRQLRDLITDEEYKGLVEYIAWDLLPILGPHLSDKEKNVKTYKNCVDIVFRLAELGNPKEMFIGLLEQVDRFLDSLVHSDLLGPLQKVIRRLGLAKPLYYNQLLATLYAHMETLAVPSVNGMGAMERRLISQEPDFSKVENTTVTLLEFLAPLVCDVEKVLVSNQLQETSFPKDITQIEGTRTEIMKFVLNLLEHPLIAIEFKYQTDPEEEKEEMQELGIGDEARQRIVSRQDEYSISKTSAEQCMFYLDSMACSFSYLLLYASQHRVKLDTLEEQRKRKARRRRQEEEEEEDGDDNKDEMLPVLGLSCFTYLLLVERYQTCRMPSVYSPVYMIQVTMPYVEAMLRRPEEPVILKGLELLASLVDKLDEQSLKSSMIDTQQSFLQVSACMVQIMIYCPSKSMRKMSLSLLPSYMDCFDWKGRYYLLRSLLISSTHSGVRAILIGKMKDYVHCTLQSVPHYNEWFLGNHAHYLCGLIFKLDRGVRTDLLNSADKEIAALNFLRYLLLRDSPEQNVTGIWMCIDIILENYVNPLQMCMDMSKAHYELSLKNTKKEIQQAVRRKEVLTGNLTVGGQKFPAMPLNEQVKVLECSRYTFDLIGSIVGRVREIVSAGKKMTLGSNYFLAMHT